MIDSKRLIRSIGYALIGIKDVIKRENTIRVHLVIAVLVLIAGIIAHLNRYEAIAITFSIGFVLVLEMTNTAIEKLVDHLHPHHHSEVAFVKDVLAGSVMIASITTAIVGIIVFYPHLKF